MTSPSAHPQRPWALSLAAVIFVLSKEEGKGPDRGSPMSISNVASTADADITEHLFTNGSRDRVTCARPIHRQRQLCSAAVRAEYRLRSRDLAITFSSRIA